MATPVLQAPGFQRRKIGDVIVTALNNGFIILPPEVLQGIGAEEQDALYRAAGRRPPFASAINGYLLQWAGRTVLSALASVASGDPTWAGCRRIS